MYREEDTLSKLSNFSSGLFGKRKTTSSSGGGEGAAEKKKSESYHGQVGR